MKCQYCGHEVPEPVVSDYCSNCGKQIGLGTEDQALQSTRSLKNHVTPIFVVRDLPSAFFPIFASIIPVSILSYYSIGLAAAIILGLIDLSLSVAIFWRAQNYLFFENRLRIFLGEHIVEDLDYSEIALESAWFSSSKQVEQGSSYEGKFIIIVKNKNPREIEIPSNPTSPELKIDLINWLKSKVLDQRKISDKNES